MLLTMRLTTWDSVQREDDQPLSKAGPVVDPELAERSRQLPLTVLGCLLHSYSSIYTSMDVVSVIKEVRERHGQGQEVAAQRIVMGMGCDAFKKMLFGTDTENKTSETMIVKETTADALWIMINAIYKGFRLPSLFNPPGPPVKQTTTPSATKMARAMGAVLGDLGGGLGGGLSPVQSLSSAPTCCP